MKQPYDFNVLVACEYSGTIRDEFTKLGFNAISCDLLPSEKPGNHIQGNVLKCLNDRWDLMIGHPPCTELSFAGNHKNNKPGQILKRIEALKFFAELYEAPIKHICIENPIGWANQAIRKPDQVIHPYFFGEPQMKRTGLWLKNLPRLTYQLQLTLFENQTATAKPSPKYISKSGKNLYFTEASTTGHARSKSFISICQAMAEQWSTILINESNNNLQF